MLRLVFVPLLSAGDTMPPTEKKTLHTTYMLDVMPLPLGCCSKSVVVFGSKSSKLFYSSTQLQVRWWQLIRYVVGRTCSHVDRFRFEIASQRAQIFEGSNEEPLAIDLPEEP